MTVEDWTGDDRRDGANFNVRSAILSEIAKTDDSSMKSILLLLFGVLEQGERGLHRIEMKIDKVLKDEQAIKKLALNGHELNHHAHHDWISDRIADECHKDCGWVGEQRKLEAEMKPVCEWAKGEMAKSVEAAQTKKGLVIKFLESIVGHIGTAIAVFAIAYITFK
jgi:hypothetical protein